MTVFAFTRETGTLGRTVAAELARQLEIAFVDHDELDARIIDRMLRDGDARAGSCGGTGAALAALRADARQVASYAAEEIMTLALASDVVIRGWEAPAILQSIPHVISVRLAAPLPFRVRRLMRRRGISTGSALVEIERDEACRVAMLRQQLGAVQAAPRVQPVFYDAVLNTGRLPVAACVHQLVDLTESRTFRQTAISRGMLERRIRELQRDRRSLLGASGRPAVRPEACSTLTRAVEPSRPVAVQSGRMTAQEAHAVGRAERMLYDGPVFAFRH